MTDFLISQYPGDGTFVIDSRLIADYLEINHSDWMQNTIKKYQSQTEQAFGVLRFENGKPQAGSKGGRPDSKEIKNKKENMGYRHYWA